MNNSVSEKRREKIFTQIFGVKPIKKVKKEKKKKPEKLGLRLSTYLKRYWLAIATYIVLYAIAGGAGIFLTIYTADSIEQITLFDYAKATRLMFAAFGFACGRRICWFLTSVVYNKYVLKMMSEMNIDMAKQAFKLDSKTYNDHDTGTFVQRIVHDPERIVTSMANIIDVLTDIVTALIMLVYISTLNIYITTVLIGLVTVGLVLEFYRIKVRRKTRKDIRKANDAITSLTTEIVHSEKDIKSLGLEEKLEEVSRERYDTHKRAMYRHSILDASFYNVRNLLIDGVGILLLIFGIWLMDADRGLLTLASFMIIYSNNGRIYSLVWGIGSIANNIVDIRISAGRMSSLFKEDEFVTEKFGNVSLDHVVGEIEFKDVSYTFREYEYNYNEKTHKTDKTLVGTNTIFRDLSFKIEPNKTVAFVGKSGSGKSTILNLMSKMYVVDGGEVLIDGHNINSLDKETIRRSISLVNQFPYIFDMTIKENLLLAKKDATDAEIKRAIKGAYLTEFVDSLKNGLDTKVGESGIKLSGGQKQRLAIARALLRNSPIIIFDESTSSLDNFAQGEVKKTIDSLKGKSTIIIVAHRLSTIKNVDEIFFLDGGEIVQKGTFDELFETNETFRAMFLAENI